MSDDEIRPGDDDTPSDDASGPQPGAQEVRHSQLSALVPEHVRRGVFSTGAVVLQGPHEFIIDFLLRMTRPHQVAARVVIAPAVVGRLITALGENLQNYEKTFGHPPGQPAAAASASADSSAAPAAASEEKAEASPTTVSDQSNTAQDLYDQLKLTDDVMSGAYANAVMIGHTATEFSFDFITTFFPRSAVSCRVYLAAPNARRFLESITQSYDQYQKKLRSQQQPPPDAPPKSD
ncbi:MAG: DUF3467 domain-containing protein [Planctomycetaceae bacterium]|jgi:hypothetical protein|nr:DUF3467 domain-containing protein [Planctomycetaceae bacterium]MBT6486532.1 DUF3467 domain-containing protein [Planctomycetaceae bacterium]MBT6497959.1 DUF3467 domain-containing protein [Planctomycetaceae bacterium]